MIKWIFRSGILLSLCLHGCTSNTITNNQTGIHNQLKYAKGIAIEKIKDNYLVEVYNPWDNYSVLSKYYLYEQEITDTIAGALYIKTPVNNAVFLSSTYIGMLCQLDARQVIKASIAANWIYDSLLYKAYLNEQIGNLGSDMTINPERIIGYEPDLVMKYIYKGEDQTDAVLKNAGLNIVYNIEFMEEHPLGRAEWIKLMGLLFGKKTEADSVFNTIENNYNSLCELAKKSGEKAKVLAGSSYKGTWYVPAGNSFVARLINDANASYYWTVDTTRGNLPLSFESVYQNQSTADVWINANASSLNEVLSVEPRCKTLKAFQNGKVYHYNKRLNPEGGLDYYESGVVRPDLLLQDLLVITHPEVFNKVPELIYWNKLK